jgi:hypothetical protein
MPTRRPSLPHGARRLCRPCNSWPARQRRDLGLRRSHDESYDARAALGALYRHRAEEVEKWQWVAGFSGSLLPYQIPPMWRRIISGQNLRRNRHSGRAATGQHQCHIDQDACGPNRTATIPKGFELLHCKTAMRLTIGSRPDRRPDGHGHHAHHARHARTCRNGRGAWAHERRGPGKSRTAGTGGRTASGGTTRPRGA